MDPEGGVSSIGFFRNKQLNPSLEKAGPLKIVGPPEKCWTPLKKAAPPWKRLDLPGKCWTPWKMLGPPWTLENYSFLWNKTIGPLCKISCGLKIRCQSFVLLVGPRPLTGRKFLDLCACRYIRQTIHLVCWWLDFAAYIEWMGCVWCFGPDFVMNVELMS